MSIELWSMKLFVDRKSQFEFNILSLLCNAPMACCCKLPFHTNFFIVGVEKSLPPNTLTNCILNPILDFTKSCSISVYTSCIVASSGSRSAFTWWWILKTRQYKSKGQKKTQAVDIDCHEHIVPVERSSSIAFACTQKKRHRLFPR